MQQVLIFDECAVAIIFIFWVAALIKKEYQTRSHKLMIVLLSLALISSMADLGAGFVCNYATGGELAISQAYSYNYIYFISHNLLLPIYLLYVYSSIDIWHIYRERSLQHSLWASLVIFDLLVLTLNGKVLDIFHITDDVVYKRGNAIFIFYAVAAIFCIWIFGVLVHYRRYINKDKLLTMMFLFVIVISGLVLQLNNNVYLVESFTIALSVLFFMIIVKRSDSQVNPITGALKYTACLDTVTKNLYSGKHISIIFIKIMNNDNLHTYLGMQGHNTFLRTVTDRAQVICREQQYNSLIYYMENGLFAIVGEDAPDAKVGLIAEKLRSAYEEEEHFGRFTVIIDARICVVFCPDDIKDAATLFSLSTNFHRTLPDTRDVHFYRDFKNNMEYQVRNDLDEILKRAVENKGFRMYYQPIYSIKEKRYVAAEAVIRLWDPEYGQVSPAVFIPAAEINGYIHDIGEFVFEDVIRFVSTLEMDRLGLKYVEVNLSATQCIEVNLVEKIKNLMFEYGVEPRHLSFELSEGATEINPEIVDSNINKLHDFGVAIALDDYGTGYSNVKRTTSLPIDQVKLDKSFVDMIDDPQMCIVIRETIDMFKEMGKEVLVEGVEKEEVARRFMDLNADLIQGCELIQGFYFCKPLPEDEFIEFIKGHRDEVYLQ